MSYGLKLRESRKRMGLTLEDVSQKTGFTKSFISQIENGKNSPSIASLKKICHSLGTSVSELFESERKVVHILHQEDYQVLAHNGIKFTFMAANFTNRKLEPIIVEIEPNGETGSDTYQHVGEEFGYMLEGEVSILIGGEDYLLKEGESAYFSSNLPHRLKNSTNKIARALWVGTPPSF